jgi:hypothetical protein
MKKATFIRAGVMVMFLMLLSFGCAAAPKAIIPLDNMNSQQLLQNPPGILVLVPEKRLEFTERLLRFLWISTKENYYTFEGIWDPSVVLEEQWIKTLQQKFNVQTISLRKKLDPAAYRELLTTCEKTCNAARKHGTASNTGWSAFDNEFSASPPESYLKSIPPDTLRSMKQVLGSDYIFELTIGGISVYSMISPNYFLRVYVYGRLIRLSDGAVLWLDKIVGATKIDNLKDYKELEANNLALLKENYEKAIVNVFDPNRKVQVGMSFSYSPSSFFKGLFPK